MSRLHAVGIEVKSNEKRSSLVRANKLTERGTSGRLDFTFESLVASGYKGVINGHKWSRIFHENLKHDRDN